MDQRRLHKFALVGGGLAVIFGAVLVLRVPEPERDADPDAIPPPRTTVQSFADDSVVLSPQGERPKPPLRLDITASRGRLVVGWGPSRIGQPEPRGAEGYEVRWGAGNLEHTRLIAEPVIQLDGLRDEVEQQIEVRTVDAFGQRSEPVRGSGTPTARTPDTTPYSFVDRFDGPVVPEPSRWELVGIGNCTKAARGAGEDTRRLVITGQCGSSDEDLALRSRAPLRLLDPASAPNGELGRFVVETDRPGQSGELTLDLVPGPADLIGQAPTGRQETTMSSQATVDPGLPPGTIRVRISGQPPDNGGGIGARVLVAPGTPLLGTPVRISPPAPPEVGVSVRWEVVLRTDGVQVVRDGEVVAGGDVVPSFTEATALVGFTGGPAGLRAAVDLIGFTGAPSAPAQWLPAPRVDFERSAAAPDSRLVTLPSGQRLVGVHTARLRITLVPQREFESNPYTVDVVGQEFPTRPAIAGQRIMPGVRYPVVADLPPDVLRANREVVGVVVRSAVPEDGRSTQVLTAGLELTGQPGQTTRITDNSPLPRGNPTLSPPKVTLLDASGAVIPPRQEVPRGRLVLDVELNPSAAQQISGSIAGLAGVEVSLDERPLAGIATAVDGPGIGGRWRIALNTGDVPAGGHTVQVTAIGAEAATAIAVAYASFVIA